MPKVSDVKTTLFGLVDFTYKNGWLPSYRVGALRVLAFIAFFCCAFLGTRASLSENLYTALIARLSSQIGTLDGIILKYLPDQVGRNLWIIICLNVIFYLISHITGVSLGAVQSWSLAYAWSMPTLTLVILFAIDKIPLLGSYKSADCPVSSPLNSDWGLVVEFLLAGWWLMYTTWWLGRVIGSSKFRQQLVYAFCFLLGIPLFRSVVLRHPTDFMGLRYFIERILEELRGNKSMDSRVITASINRVVAMKRKVGFEPIQLFILETLRFWTSFAFNIGASTDGEIDKLVTSTSSQSCRDNYTGLFSAIKLCVVAPCALVGFAYGRFLSSGFGHMESTKKTLGWGKSPSSTSASSSASASASTNGSGDKSPRAKSRSRSRSKKNW